MDRYDNNTTRFIKAAVTYCRENDWSNTDIVEALCGTFGVQCNQIADAGYQNIAQLLNVRNAQQWYGIKRSIAQIAKKQDKKWVKAVDDVSFTLKRGEVLGVIGESGCGKSTLGRMLAMLEKPYGGYLELDGQDYTRICRKDVLTFRRKVQIVFQNPFETFDPRHVIEDILMQPLEIHSIGSSVDERRRIICDGLEKLGITPAEDYLSRWPHELSGGQLQRISVLRSMLLNPLLIIADEPVSMLDVSVRADLLNTLMNLVHEYNMAMVFISHDIAVTNYVADRVAVMYLGRIVEMGTADQIIKNPQHPYTKVLISNFPSLDFDKQTKPISIHGEPPTPINPGPGCYFAPRCYMATERCFREYPSAIEGESGHTVCCHCAANV